MLSNNRSTLPPLTGEWTTHRDSVLNAIDSYDPPSTFKSTKSLTDRFTVCARVRPMLPTETYHPDMYDCVTVHNGRTIAIHSGEMHLGWRKTKHTAFQLDHAFGQEETTEVVYEKAVRGAVAASIPAEGTEAVDSTVFLFGKTGTGKSHTIAGITHLFAQDIFYLLSQSSIKLQLSISIIEIVAGAKGFVMSNDTVCDLLNNGNIIRFRDDEHGVTHLRGAVEAPCPDPDTLDAHIRNGQALRRTQATTRNATSSRSHLVYFVHVRGNSTSGSSPGPILSTITLVDLAGTESKGDTLHHTDKTRIEDTASINRSLSALKDCIRAAAAGAKVIPFRGSTLTRLVKKCFLDRRVRTVFIGTLSGVPADAEQSRATVKYMGMVKWGVKEFVDEQKVLVKTPTDPALVTKGHAKYNTERHKK
ncbi:hypothetical protein HDV00_011241 [Rhizophlyctis rosea]|nr:hypothetical protein HDV00_011241 [Rhizophlyctis rosea]